jgi:hypothetical protein
MIAPHVAASRDMPKKKAQTLDICNRVMGYAVGPSIQHNS